VLAIQTDGPCNPVPLLCTCIQLQTLQACHLWSLPSLCTTVCQHVTLTSKGSGHPSYQTSKRAQVILHTLTHRQGRQTHNQAGDGTPPRRSTWWFCKAASIHAAQPPGARKAQLQQRGTEAPSCNSAAQTGNRGRPQQHCTKDLQTPLHKGRESRPQHWHWPSTHRSIAAAIKAHHLCMTRTRTERDVLFVRVHFSFSSGCNLCSMPLQSTDTQPMTPRSRQVTVNVASALGSGDAHDADKVAELDVGLLALGRSHDRAVCTAKQVSTDSEVRQRPMISRSAEQ
jgi:hypothetical protein